LLELEARRGAGDEAGCDRGEGCEDPGPDGDAIIGVSPDDIFQ
jgi:hypothetical protein